MKKKKLIKRIVAIVAIVLLLIGIIYYGDKILSSVGNNNNGTSDSSTQSSKNPGESIKVIEVSGKEFVADMSTLNVAWDEGNEPTDIQKNNFMNMIKTWFGSSVISFQGETSLTMTGTNNGNNDFVAENCERIDNELFKEISKGNIDIIVYEDKVSFLCDFFVKGWGMYVSIDYKIVQNQQPSTNSSTGE